MKRILIVFALFLVSSSTAWAICPGAAAGCGAATRYDVDVQEVALCQDAACASNHVVGAGAKTFDIASAAVGAAIGAYANVDAIPVGVYTHVRVVISRNFKISTAGVISGCAAQTNATLSIPNTPNDGFDGLNGLGPALTWNDAAQTQVRVIQAFPAPIAISKAGTRPAVTVKFNTQTGFMCINTPGATPFPAPPEVTFSVN